MPDASGQSRAPAEPDALVVPDRDLAHIGRAVRFLSSFGILTAVAALAMGAWLDSGVLANAGLIIGGASVMSVWAWSLAATRGAGWFVPRWVVIVLVTVVSLAALVPELVAVLTAAALIPVAVALPFVKAHTLRRLMVAVWAISLGMAVMTEFVTYTSGIPPWALALLRIEAVAGVSGLLMVLLWYYRGRLAESSRELSGLVTLSRDLAETLDPRDIGERLARHLAEAAHGDSCVISSWDRAQDAVVGFATYPPEALATFDRRAFRGA